MEGLSTRGHLPESEHHNVGMLRTIYITSALVALTSALTPAHASGGIVYSGRYYNPPGVKATSQYHIYTIDPDGKHKRQLTSGVDADQVPRWSPDGKHIAFLRYSSETYVAKLCVMTASGASLRILGTDNADALLWIDDDHVAIPNEVGYRSFDIRDGSSSVHPKTRSRVASPDGRYTLRFDANGAVVLDKAGHTTALDTAVAGPYDYSPDRLIWQNDTTLTYLTPGSEAVNADPKLDDAAYALLGFDGQVKKTLHFNVVRQGFGNNYPGMGSFERVQPFVADPKFFIAVENWHNSTVGTDLGYYKVEAATGKTKFLREGQFIVWSPSGQQFCISPGRDTTDYEKRKDGTWRLVWTSPLSVVDARTNGAHQITPRLSSVTSADWR